MLKYSIIFIDFNKINNLEKWVDQKKNEYILNKMDKNIYKKVVQIVKDEEELVKNFGDILVLLISFGRIKGKNITYELQKAVNKWEKNL
ncbi:hypothetical protein [Anaerobranca gottschalkii]|uniref:Uncharacterized protein n=1 Tax=Anaerobranca gottschalkii DSM 13577 TaxID=1120990 RepID=A0A1I0CX06_9FIRM|nr:hypothetical protein [Anaerobranca gottschalkii]SET23967.1 hypothetical protein SAMN03080614_11011 [Anaerobranca gottschalkii DSM 13577]